MTHAYPSDRRGRRAGFRTLARRLAPWFRFLGLATGLALCCLLPGGPVAHPAVKLLQNDRQVPSATTRAAGNSFGYAVAISGDYAVVGVPLDDEDATGGNMVTDAGSAYVFVRSGTSWSQQQKLGHADNC